MITTGEALRLLAPAYPSTVEMRHAINEVWREHDRRLTWAACAVLLYARLRQDESLIQECSLVVKAKVA